MQTREISGSDLALGDKLLLGEGSIVYTVNEVKKMNGFVFYSATTAAGMKFARGCKEDVKFFVAI